jgi:hypothetical protein
MGSILEEDFVLYEIFMQSTVPDLLLYEQVSTSWQDIVNKDSLWRHFCVKDHKINFKAKDQLWREMYRVDLKKWKICLHLANPDEEFESAALNLVKLRINSASRKCIEENCQFPFNTLWLCMYPGCGYYGCGRRDNAHSKNHHKLTGHPLHIKLNTLEMWCHTCKKWTGDDPQIDHIAEIERAREIRRRIVKLATHWNVMDEKSIERRKMERTLIEQENNNDTFILYVVDTAWVKLWERYVIGDEEPPQSRIDNSSFIEGSRLNLRDRRDFSYVSPTQWHYFKKVYGASPGIQLTIDKTTRACIEYKIEID